MKSLKTADFIYKASLHISFIPLIAFICQIAFIRTDIILVQMLCLTTIASLFSLLIYSRRTILSSAYALAAGLISFLVNIKINLFYRLIISAIIFILCMLTSEKKKKTIQSVYMFAGISFLNTVICILINNSFLSLICFFIYAFAFGYIKILMAQEKVTKTHIFNFKILAIPGIVLLLLALISIPLSGFIEKLFKITFRKMFNNNETENEITENLEINKQNKTLPEIIPVEQNHYIKYILVSIIIIILLFFIIYISHEFLLFRNSQRQFKINVSKLNCISKNDEYTEMTGPLEKDEIISIISDSPKRRWKKSYRKYQKMKWSDIKLKTGFELALNGLRIYGIEIKNSDTLSDIEIKVPDEIIELWKKAAMYYAIYKYNDKLPDKSAQRSFDDLIFVLNRKIYEKKKSLN